MTPRQLARRIVPYEARLRTRLWRRWWHDHLSRVGFATSAGDPSEYPHTICAYTRAFVDYPGQEAFALAKRRNQSLLARHLHGVVIQPGETFSVWHLAPRPTEKAGYLPAAALKSGVLTSETGGAICLLSTVLYNIALLGALEITERYCHSVDTYGEHRYFELARDAAIEYGYRDLRFRNTHPFPVLVEIEITGDAVTAGLRSAIPAPFHVTLEVDASHRQAAGWSVSSDRALATGESRVVREPLAGLAVKGRRIISRPDCAPTTEPLPPSHHEPVAGLLHVARPVRAPRQRHTRA